jgi:hypothetical protein
MSIATSLHLDATSVLAKKDVWLPWVELSGKREGHAVFVSE